MLGALALCAGMGLAVTPASGAAQTTAWRVDPGGAFAGQATTVVFSLRRVRWPCATSTADGTLAASDGDGLAAGTVDVMYSNCRLAGIVLDFKAVGTWKVDLLQKNSAHSSWVDVAVSGIDLKWAGPGCAVEFKGTQYGHYDNDTGRLVLGSADDPASKLISLPGSSCLGLVSPDEVATMQATYSLTPAQKITPAT